MLAELFPTSLSHHLKKYMYHFQGAEIVPPKRPEPFFTMPLLFSLPASPRQMNMYIITPRVLLDIQGQVQLSLPGSSRQLAAQFLGLPQHFTHVPAKALATLIIYKFVHSSPS